MKMLSVTVLCFLLFLSVFTVLTVNGYAGKTTMEKGSDLMHSKPSDYPVATFAGGCFWCVESEFRAQTGVLYTRVGYMGGDLDTPSYRDITTGQTGHAEVVEVTFDPSKTSFEALVEFFLTKAHDPTQLNKQGVDVGTQYRSSIFYHDEEQHDAALRVISDIDNRTLYPSKIVTTLEKAQTFWEGEEYHQQYYEKYEKDNGQVHPRVFFKKQMKKLKQ